MRIPPPHVVAALRSYDPDLGLEWDQRTAAWWFTWRGQRWWVWKHRDGEVAMNDLTATEALCIVQAADNHRDGGIRLRAAEVAHRDRRARRHIEDQQAMIGAHTRAKDRARVLMQGPKPIVHMS